MKKSIFVIIIIMTTLGCQSNKKEQVSSTEMIEQVTSDKDFFNEKGRIVTPQSYPTDETSRQILKSQSLVGVNNILHNRKLTPTDNQPVVRMNRDTYYSFGVVDVSKGAKITMPNIPEGKYMSVQGVTEDHRIQAMKYGPGIFDLSTHKGNHLYLIIRLDATFTESEAKDIQDKMRIESNSNEKFRTVPVNQKSFIEVEDALKSKLPAIAKEYGVNTMRGMFTDPNDESSHEFSDDKYQVGAAAGWGGAQMNDNIYEASRNFSTDSCYQLTFEDPKNRAFWSITVYDAKGFMFNNLASFSSNSAQANGDGTYTISFGCGEGEPNNIEVANSTNQFNIVVRHYQPSKRVIEEDYRLVPMMKKILND